MVCDEDSEAERHNPSRSAKSKANKKAGDDDIDRKGIESIMKASSAVSEALLGPLKRKAAYEATATAPKRTKVKKPGPQTDDQKFWKHFSELFQYKAGRDDRHLSSLITCSVKVCHDYYELNN
jgi:hypothetical protein